MMSYWFKRFDGLVKKKGTEVPLGSKRPCEVQVHDTSACSTSLRKSASAASRFRR